ncbi:MAG: hypothetical protein KGZ71_11045 [Desulfobulbaceae bacterium]|nr:hypothetical protein [Desulfobulbaceae bacterium]
MIAFLLSCKSTEIYENHSESSVKSPESSPTKTTASTQNQASEDRIVTEHATFKTVQTNDYDWIDIYFNSETEATGIIKLYTISGDEILNKSTKVRKGKNSARISTLDFLVGMYLLVVDIDGRILSGTISVAR